MKTFKNRKEGCPARNFGYCLILGKPCLEENCVPWHFEKPYVLSVKDHEYERKITKLKEDITKG